MAQTNQVVTKNQDLDPQAERALREVMPAVQRAPHQGQGGMCGLLW